MSQNDFHENDSHENSLGENNFLDSLQALNRVLPREQVLAEDAAGALDEELAALRAEVSEKDAHLAFLDRLHAAAPELERMEKLHPSATSLPDLLGRAGATPTALGLREEDLPRIEEYLRELREDGPRD